MEIDKNRDFPFERLNLNLTLIADNSASWNLRGEANMFKRKGWINTDITYSRFNHGKIVPSIRFNIRSNKHVIEIEELENSVSIITRHELLHAYQYYKKYKNKSKHYTNNAASCAVIHVMSKSKKKKKFSEFMRFLYALLTKEEFEANLSEFTIGLNTRKARKMMKYKDEIESTTKEIYVNKIKEELSESEMNEIVKLFSRVYLEVSKSYNLKPSKFIVDLTKDGFDHFIDSTYDIVKKRLDKWGKKINKIDYNLSQKDQ